MFVPWLASIAAIGNWNSSSVFSGPGIRLAFARDSTHSRLPTRTLLEHPTKVKYSKSPSTLEALGIAAAAAGLKPK